MWNLDGSNVHSRFWHDKRRYKPIAVRLWFEVHLATSYNGIGNHLNKTRLNRVPK